MKVNSIYEAGRVERWHTHGAIPAQTIADHAWGVTMIILAEHPDPSPSLIKAAIFHDIGEFETGDNPAPIKRASPSLKGQLDVLEAEAVLRMGIEMPELTVDEKGWLKYADRKEAQLYIGFRRDANRLMTVIHGRLTGMIEKGSER